MVSYLLGINTKKDLVSGPYLGPLFETLVVVDFWKRFLHHGQIPSLYYLRTQDDLEIDLMIELEDKLHLLEIKSSETITSHHAASLIRAKRDLKDMVGKTLIISNAKEQFTLKGGIEQIPASKILVG